MENTTLTPTLKNPLRAALDQLGRSDAVKALVDACDREVERHHVHGWARELDAKNLSIPSADDRRTLDQGFKRLGVRRGLSEAAWKPWIAEVSRRRRAVDRRRAEVRTTQGLPPFRGSRGKVGGGRAPVAPEPTAAK